MKLSIKNYEQQFFNNFIDELLEIIEQNKEIVRNWQISDIVFYLCQDIQEKNIFFHHFSKNNCQLLCLKETNDIHNIITPIKQNISLFLKNIDDSSIYLNHCKQFKYYILNFISFLHKYSLQIPFLLKEFIIAFIIPLMLLPLGTLNNYDLANNIIIIWVLYDNMCDGKNVNHEMTGKWKKEIKEFFIGKYFKNDKKRREYCQKYSGNPIIDCLNEIWKNNYPFENILAKKFYKLFLFCYSNKGKNKENQSSNMKELLCYSSLKARKTVDLFVFCLDNWNNLLKIKTKKWNEEFQKKYYYFSLALQLLDDLDDMEKDFEENSKTPFTSSNHLERISLIILLKWILKQFTQPFQQLFYQLLINAIEKNLQYLPPNLKNNLQTHLPFIDFNSYDGIFFSQCLMNPTFATNLCNCLPNE